MTETQTIKITKSYYDEERTDAHEGVYEVRRNGEYLGDVSRDDSVSTGYWGRWNAGRQGFETRKQAVAYLCRRRDAVTTLSHK